ncbi:MAG: DUF938 domain-containing protein [Gammaproteobacteria bacterium]|jgi:hypothetical protein
MNQKPFAAACERNREPILAVLRNAMAGASHVLEIGSGTGQHAVYFARALPHVIWQTSDLPDNHPGIRAWLAEGPANARPPLALDVSDPDWPVSRVDAAFTANTAHIMHWPAVEAMFAGLGRLLPPGAPFCLYGPFHRDGRPTAPGNAEFDAWLRARDPGMGVRDIKDVLALGEAHGLSLVTDHAMPASNRLLEFRRAG